jgi:hypothetical protein
MIPMPNSGRLADKSGAALLITLLTLSLFSLIGLYMALNATTSVRISDNFESQLQATYAALAGLNHASALLRGLDWNAVLKGPDGSYDDSASYSSSAKTFGFRMPFSILASQTLNIFDPAMDTATIPEDGLVNTGFYEGIDGTILIPKTGIALFAPNPYGAGTILTSRYFVKVTDNNGDSSEIAGDPEDNPFIDGDGMIIVRSIGVSKTLSENSGSISRRNSVAVFESRLKRLSTWNLGPALVVLGAGVNAAFSGSYEISGGASPGIGTIDTILTDAIFSDCIIQSAAATGGNISGGNLPNPSVCDITGQVSANRDQSLLLNPSYLWDFIYHQAPSMADNYFDSSQNWQSGSAPYLGAYDNSKALNAPGQDPQITVVNGDLQITGSISGGGLLIVTGNFSYSGAYSFNGLVLIIGSGSLTADGSGQGIDGGTVIANLQNAGGNIAFGTPAISIGGNSRLSSNRNAVQMAIGLIPASQISFREITGADP